MSELGHNPHRQTISPVIQAAGRPADEERVVADLQISLFGTIRLDWRGREVRFAGRNARALIAILALERRPRFRDDIAADLWPDLAEPEAGSALRQALWLLRCGMVDAGIDAAAILDCDKERIGLQAESTVELDVARFEDCMLGHPACVEEAIDLYRGDLAEGINLECLARDRERLADLFEDALAEASRRRLLDGNLFGAREAALRLLRRDPLREEAHMVLIELYGLIGSRSQVSRQYRRLRAILEAELNVEPLQETEDLYRIAIRRAAARSDMPGVWASGSVQALGGSGRN
jgi:DNA-binding transcriptional activator of the SARP family